MRRRYGTFTGGIELADEKQATLVAAVEPCPPLDRLCIPLSWGGGLAAAQPTVAIGQRVTAGQVIAQAAESGDGPHFQTTESGVSPRFPTPRFLALLDGTVSRFCTAAVADAHQFVSVPAIELTDLSAPQPPPAVKPDWDWQGADGSTIRARMAATGLTTFRRGGASLAGWIDAARAKGCRTLIANGMESQPYVAADHRLLVEHGKEVLLGLVLLAKALEVPDVQLAVDHRRTGAYRDVVGPCRLHRIEPVALLHKYPTGLDRILVNILLRREAPMGGSPLDVGAAVATAALCWAAYRAVACGAPALGRVVTVAGDGGGRRGNYFVPFGARCADLVGADRATLVHGGPLTGLACPEDAVVGPSTDAVLTLHTTPDSPGPCIRCGWCADQCPARLNVAALNDQYELGQIDRARRAGVLACVECGVCSYICPARLPLTQRVLQLKAAVRQPVKERA